MLGNPRAGHPLQRGGGEVPSHRAVALRPGQVSNGRPRFVAELWMGQEQKDRGLVEP